MARLLFLQRPARHRHHLAQAVLLGLSAAAIAMVDLGTTERIWFWGNVIGLLAQPLWFYTSWCARQWGIFALAFFYTGVWSAGALRYL